MTSDAAIKLFNIDDLLVETDESVKRKYRKLMVKYHPDNCNDADKAKDVVEAYSILKKLLDKVKNFKLLNSADDKKRIDTVLIPIDKLIEIYSGNLVELTVGSEKIKFNNVNIRRFNVFVIIDVEITHNGVTDNYSTIQPFRADDTYDIDYSIYVNDLYSEEEISILLNGKDRKIKMQSQSLRFRCNLGYNTFIQFVIDKKIREEN